MFYFSYSLTTQAGDDLYKMLIAAHENNCSDTQSPAIFTRKCPEIRLFSVPHN